MRQFVPIILCGFLFAISTQAVSTQTVFGVNNCDNPITSQKMANWGVVAVSIKSKQSTGFIVNIDDIVDSVDGTQKQICYIVMSRHGLTNKNKADAKLLSKEGYKVNVQFFRPLRKTFPAEVLEDSEILDIALLKVEVPKTGVYSQLRSLSLNEQCYINEGEEGYTIGHHTSLWKKYPLKQIWTSYKSEGKVLGFEPNVKPGVSGGPLIQNGCVIGVIKKNDLAVDGQRLSSFLKYYRALGSNEHEIGSNEHEISITHTVKDGENLSEIAGIYYDRTLEKCWCVILKANPELKGNPDDIDPGMTLKIPPKPKDISKLPKYCKAVATK